MGFQTLGESAVVQGVELPYSGKTFRNLLSGDISPVLSLLCWEQEPLLVVLLRQEQRR